MTLESYSQLFRLKTPFPPGSFDLNLAARRIAKSANEHSAVFVGPPLSGFITDEFKHHANTRINRAWWHGAAPLVVCRGPSLADACFAVLTPEVRGISFVQELFHSCKFPYALVSDAEGLEEHASRIRDALRASEHQGVCHHWPQEHFAKSLQSYFGSEIDDAKFASLLEEIALSTIIELPDWSTDDYRAKWTPKRSPEVVQMANLGNKTSFDFLCTREAPRLFPSLAIEFDGSRHDTDPTKVSNDRLKDRVCYEAGLPLLRVCMQFVGPSNADPITNGFIAKSFRRNFAKFACEFVWYTADAWGQAIISTDRVNADPKDRHAARVKTLHRMFPTIAKVHRGLVADLSKEEQYQDLFGRRPEITMARDDDKGIQASIRIDGEPFRSPWIRIKGGVPRPLVDWDELVEAYCRSFVTTKALKIDNA